MSKDIGLTVNFEVLVLQNNGQLLHSGAGGCGPVDTVEGT